MQKIFWNALSADEKYSALSRPEHRHSDQVISFVKEVFSSIGNEGDVALNRYCQALDSAPAQVVDITAELAEQAIGGLSADDYAAIKLAKEHIETFHRAEQSDGYTVEVTRGVTCSREFRPLASAGLYIPGGSAPLFSTLLMLAIPARVAGVENIVLCTPPDSHGDIHPAIIASAYLCGIDKIYAIGGAQAIAALTIGTDLVPKVDIITGPGNAYVSYAKSYAASLPGGPGIDMPAGPSELLVVADAAADPRIIAADLLSQAEHDPLSQVVLVCGDDRIATGVEEEITAQLADLPRRSIALRALEHARLLVTDSIENAITICNQYAPEHLSLNMENAEELLPAFTNAGTIFVGPWSAETFGDYVAGPSHVLPTDGAARMWSGVSVATFLRSMTIQRISQDGANALAPVSAALARLEGLEAHARAAEFRTPKRGDV